VRVHARLCHFLVFVAVLAATASLLLPFITLSVVRNLVTVCAKLVDIRAKRAQFSREPRELVKNSRDLPF